MEPNTAPSKPPFEGPRFDISPLATADQSWVSAFVSRQWGSSVVISRGRLHRPSELPGFVARREGQLLGLATYHIADLACEVVTLDSLEQGLGIGSALLAAVEEAARRLGCRRLWLITTNDNTPALRWYQRRGLHLAALHRGAVDLSRRLKPEIPEVGLDGIPIRDEIELEKRIAILPVPSPHPLT